MADLSSTAALNPTPPYPRPDPVPNFNERLPASAADPASINPLSPDSQGRPRSLQGHQSRAGQVAIGQIVYFYAAPGQQGGMKKIDDNSPCAAIVAGSVSDRLVNLLVIDHRGSTFACESVPLFLGDDKDDHSALCHCGLDAPAPNKSVTVSGVKGQPTALNLGAEVPASDSTGPILASVDLIFTVPAGNTYTFNSKNGGINRAFTADTRPQTLTLTAAQIAAGVLSDLTITTLDDADVLLTVVAVESVQAPDGTVVKTGKSYRIIETVVFGPAPPATAVLGNPATLSLVATAAAVAKVGQSYLQTNAANGGIAPYTYSVSAGSLPAGTTLNASTGTVSGTPTTAGPFSYTIKGTDSTGPVALTATQVTSGTVAPSV